MVQVVRLLRPAQREAVFDPAQVLLAQPQRSAHTRQGPTHLRVVGRPVQDGEAIKSTVYMHASVLPQTESEEVYQKSHFGRFLSQKLQNKNLVRIAKNEFFEKNSSDVV